MKLFLAVVDKSGRKAPSAITEAFESLSLDYETARLGMVTDKQIIEEDDIGRLRNKIPFASAALGFAKSSHPMEKATKTIGLNGATAVLEGEVYKSAHELPAKVFTNQTKSEYKKSVREFVNKEEGDYALIVLEALRIVATRDPMGAQPLYYGENRNFVALASNRKTLWKLGIGDPKTFPPGNIAEITQEGCKFSPVKTIAKTDPKSIGRGEAAKVLQRMLGESVLRRVSGVKRIAVAFSGGLDSSILAALAKKCGADVELIHVSLENRSETEEAWKAAEELDLPMQVHLFKESDVEMVVSEVVELIEDSDPVKVSVGVPFYWTAQKSAQAGYRVLLAGQGADELFGGYKRYVTEYITEGDEKVRHKIYCDVINMHETNIERDKKICNFHNVELRLPFASFELAKFAISLPTELKFECKENSLRKLLLRQVAKNLGVSKSLADKPKKAVQYSTGVSNVLKKIANKRGLNVPDYVGKLYDEMKKKSLESSFF